MVFRLLVNTMPEIIKQQQQNMHDAIMMVMKAFISLRVKLIIKVYLHSFKCFPKLSFIFLIVSLGISGFPITPTFIGEDIILGHIHQNQYLMITLTALSLILDGLAIFRIYARLFLGPHYKMNHEVAYRSS